MEDERWKRKRLIMEVENEKEGKDMSGTMRCKDKKVRKGVRVIDCAGVACVTNTRTKQ